MDLRSISLGIRDENDNARFDRNESDVWHHPLHHADIPDIGVLSTVVSLGLVILVPRESRLAPPLESSKQLVALLLEGKKKKKQRNNTEMRAVEAAE